MTIEHLELMVMPVHTKRYTVKESLFAAMHINSLSSATDYLPPTLKKILQQPRAFSFQNTPHPCYPMI